MKQQLNRDLGAEHDKQRNRCKGPEAGTILACLKDQGLVRLANTE
jgi:hypothetical protein